MLLNRFPDLVLRRRKRATLVSAAVSRRGTLAFGLLAASLGCWSGTPYPLVKIEGSVTYEDGEVIPADGLELRFVPQAPPRDPRIPPKPATVYVNAATGEFSTATTYRHDDGVIRGEHRVMVRATSGDRPDSGLVPSEYGRADTTPLVVDTRDSPLRLTVMRPQTGE